MLRRILLTALFALPALAADIAGKWNFEVDLGGQSGTPKFAFQQKGETLTGTVKGDDISFQFETSGIKVTYIGKVTSPTTMKGRADYGGQAEGTWTAKKD